MVERRVREGGGLRPTSSGTVGVCRFCFVATGVQKRGKGVTPNFSLRHRAVISVEKETEGGWTGLVGVRGWVCRW